jgi:hypothetical protein
MVVLNYSFIYIQKVSSILFFGIVSELYYWSSWAVEGYGFLMASILGITLREEEALCVSCVGVIETENHLSLARLIGRFGVWCMDSLGWVWSVVELKKQSEWATKQIIIYKFNMIIILHSCKKVQRHYLTIPSFEFMAQSLSLYWKKKKKPSW